MNDTLKGALGYLLWLTFGFFFMPIVHLLNDPSPLDLWPWMLGSEALAVVAIVLFRVVVKD